MQLAANGFEGKQKLTNGNETSKVADKKKKNVFGLDFEIPDELQQLIVMEMKQKEKKS
jgi:hypothetical protein